MVLPTRDLSETSMSSVAELIEEAFGEIGHRVTINFHLFYALLLIISKDLSVLERKVLVKFPSTHILPSIESSMSITSVRVKVRGDKKRKSIDQRRKSRDDRRISRDDRRMSRDDRRKSRDDRDRRKSRDLRDEDDLARKSYRQEHEGPERKPRKQSGQRTSVDRKRLSHEERPSVSAKRKSREERRSASEKRTSHEEPRKSHDKGKVSIVSEKRTSTGASVERQSRDEEAAESVSAKRKSRDQKSSDDSRRKSREKEVSIDKGTKKVRDKQYLAEGDEDDEYKEKSPTKETGKRGSLPRYSRKSDAVSADESVHSEETDRKSYKSIAEKPKKKHTKLSIQLDKDENISVPEKSGKADTRRTSSRKTSSDRVSSSRRSSSRRDSSDRVSSSRASDKTEGTPSGKTREQAPDSSRKSGRKSVEKSFDEDSSRSSTEQTFGPSERVQGKYAAPGRGKKTQIEKSPEKNIRSAILESSESSDYQQEKIIIVEKLPVGVKESEFLPKKPQQTERVVPQSLVTTEQLLKLADEVAALQERFGVSVDDGKPLAKAFHKTASISEPIAILQLSNRLEVAEKALEKMLPVVTQMLKKTLGPASKKAVPGTAIPEIAVTEAQRADREPIRASTMVSGVTAPDKAILGTGVPGATLPGTSEPESKILSTMPTGGPILGKTVTGVTAPGTAVTGSVTPGVAVKDKVTPATVTVTASTGLTKQSPTATGEVAAQQSAIPTTKVQGTKLPTSKRPGVSEHTEQTKDADIKSTTSHPKSKSQTKDVQLPPETIVKQDIEQATDELLTDDKDKLPTTASDISKGGISIMDQSRSLITPIELRNRMQELEDEIRRALKAPTSRTHLTANNASKLAMLVEEQLDTALDIENKMAALEELVKKYSEKVNALDTQFSKMMTAYQEELAQMQHNLETAVDNMAEALANRVTDMDAVSELNNRFTSLQIDIERTDDCQTDLKILQTSLDLDLENLWKQIEILKKVKSDRDEVAKALSTKAGLLNFNGMLSMQFYDAVYGELQKELASGYNIFNSQELVWKRLIDDAMKTLFCRADKAQVEFVRNNVNENFDMLRDRLDVMLEICKTPDMDYPARQVIRDKDCLSCSVPPVADDEKVNAAKKRRKSHSDEKDDDHRRPCIPNTPIRHALDDRAYICPNHCGGYALTGDSNSDISESINSAISVISLRRELKPKMKVTEIMVPCIPCNPQEKKMSKGSVTKVIRTTSTDNSTVFVKGEQESIQERNEDKTKT